MNIEEQRKRAIATHDRLRSPETADNLDVRKALLDKVRSGEMTLQQAQAQLKKIQSFARSIGQQTAYL